MRGPQVRVLINLENLNAEKKAINNQTPILESQHNVKLILYMVEADIQKFYNQNLRHEREGEGATLERDYTTKTTTRKHRGYYGSHKIESRKVLW